LKKGPLIVESRRWNVFWWEGNPFCFHTNLLDYDLVSNDAFQQAWLAGFKETQNNASNVGMKDVFLFHGKWGNPWPSSFIDLLNIINCCAIEVNEDGSEVVNDFKFFNYASHKFVSRNEYSFVTEIDVLVRIPILDIEQQTKMMGCILDFNIAKTTKVSSTIDVPGKGSIFKMRLITKLNAHSPYKLPLDRLRWVQYKTCVRGSFTQEDHEVEEVGLFDDVGIIMKEDKKLTWYLGCAKEL